MTDFDVPKRVASITAKIAADPKFQALKKYDGGITSGIPGTFIFDSVSLLHSEKVQGALAESVAHTFYSNSFQDTGTRIASTIATILRKAPTFTKRLEKALDLKVIRVAVMAPAKARGGPIEDISTTIHKKNPLYQTAMHEFSATVDNIYQRCISSRTSSPLSKR